MKRFTYNVSVTSPEISFESVSVLLEVCISYVDLKHFYSCLEHIFRISDETESDQSFKIQRWDKGLIRRNQTWRVLGKSSSHPPSQTCRNTAPHG